MTEKLHGQTKAMVEADLSQIVEIIVNILHDCFFVGAIQNLIQHVPTESLHSLSIQSKGSSFHSKLTGQLSC